MVTGTSYVETAPTDLARLLEYLFTDRCGRCRQSADDTTDRMAAMQRTLNQHRRPLALSEECDCHRLDRTGKKLSRSADNLKFASSHISTLASHSSATPRGHHVMPCARLPKSLAHVNSYLGLDGHLLRATSSWGSMMPASSNWRSPNENDYLKHLDRAGFAWEFLRRNQTYQEDYETIVRGATSDVGSGGTTSEALARRWGLSFPGRSKACRRPSGCVLAARDVAHDCSARARPGTLFRSSAA
jgi:Family of unknown function (DUF6499)